MGDQFRYAYQPRTGRRSVHLRRFQDPILHEKFYAFLKHRAQARFRGEPYHLTWEDWCVIWTDQRWALRGRGPRSLRLTMRVAQRGWRVNNCEIMPHGDHISKITRARNLIKPQRKGTNSK